MVHLYHDDLLPLERAPVALQGRLTSPICLRLPRSAPLAILAHEEAACGRYIWLRPHPLKTCVKSLVPVTENQLAPGKPTRSGPSPGITVSPRCITHFAIGPLGTLGALLPLDDPHSTGRGRNGGAGGVGGGAEAVPKAPGHETA